MTEALSSKVFVGIRSRGATMLEFALIAPIFFVLLLLIYDLGKFAAIRSILTKTSQDFVNVAQKFEATELDTRVGGNFNLYQDALLTGGSSLEARLQGFVAGTFVGDLMHQIRIRPLQNPPGGGSFLGPLSFILLRPGDSAVDDTLGGEVVEHPTLPTASVTGVGNYPQLLREHPLHMELRARGEFVTPAVPGLILGLPAITLRVTARGYRELAVRPDLFPIVAIPPPTIPSTSTTSTTSSSTTSTSTTSTSSTSTSSTTSSTSSTTSSSSTSSTSSSSTSSSSSSSSSTTSTGSSTTSTGSSTSSSSTSSSSTTSSSTSSSSSTSTSSSSTTSSTTSSSSSTTSSTSSTSSTTTTSSTSTSTSTTSTSSTTSTDCTYIPGDCDAYCGSGWYCRPASCNTCSGDCGICCDGSCTHSCVC